MAAPRGALEGRPDFSRRRAAAHPKSAVGVGRHRGSRGGPEAVPLPSLVLRRTGGSTNARFAAG
eukprot:3121621-Lingulodinium_polyedra.AAC.1